MTFSAGKTFALALRAPEVKAITRDQALVPIVELQIVGFATATSYRFLPNGQALIVLEGVRGASQNFFRVDLATGQRVVGYRRGPGGRRGSLGSGWFSF